MAGEERTRQRRVARGLQGRWLVERAGMLGRAVVAAVPEGRWRPSSSQVMCPHAAVASADPGGACSCRPPIPFGVCNHLPARKHLAQWGGGRRSLPPRVGHAAYRVRSRAGGCWGGGAGRRLPEGRAAGPGRRWPALGTTPPLPNPPPPPSTPAAGLRPGTPARAGTGIANKKPVQCGSTSTPNLASTPARKDKICAKKKFKKSIQNC